MKSLSADLRAAREARGISLEEIAQKTMINIDFLRAIEQGNTSILPPIYVRAFLREYAVVVGLDPDEILRRCTELDASLAAPAVQVYTDPPAEEETAAAARATPPWWERPFLRAAIISIGAIGVILAISYFSRQSAPPQVKEIPFSAIVRENEQRLTPEDSVHPPAVVVVESPRDSLVLKGVTSDSVWVQITVDGLPPADYLFPPRASRQWKAKERFAITLGNAGGIRFRLNGHELGALGKPGSVVRNVEVTRQNLKSPPSVGSTP